MINHDTDEERRGRRRGGDGEDGGGDGEDGEGIVAAVETVGTAEAVTVAVIAIVLQ